MAVATLAHWPWWTLADQTELDALTRELVNEVFEHRKTCAWCVLDLEPCPHVREAIEAVLDWRERRELHSRAVWLRRQRDLLEYLQAAQRASA